VCSDRLAPYNGTPPPPNLLTQADTVSETVCIFNMFNMMDNIVTSLSDSRRGFRLDIGFIDPLRIVTTSNYNRLVQLHTSNNSGTTTHLKFSVFSNRFLATDFYTVTMTVS
jgi:hypothetical protein